MVVSKSKLKIPGKRDKSKKIVVDVLILLPIVLFSYIIGSVFLYVVPFNRYYSDEMVVGYDDFMKCYNMNEAKTKGLVEVVDRDHIINDGDVIEIRFNV